MDKQAFKQRMQNLKSYRENNPGKGYWDWKVQSFENGGEVTRKSLKDIRKESTIGDKLDYDVMLQNQNTYQKEFATNWYKERAKNPKYRSQLGNGKLDKVLSDIDKATWKNPTEAMKDNLISQGYTPTEQNIKSQLQAINAKGTKGFAVPSMYSYYGAPRNTWHEGIGHIVGDNNPAILDSTPNISIPSNDPQYSDYINQANEKHAQTWDFRGKNQTLKDDAGNYYIDPNRQLSSDDIQEMIDKGAVIPDQWKDITTQDISDLTNTFAYNYAEGGEVGNPNDEFTKAINIKLGRTSDGRPKEQGLKPVIDLEDAANITPIGDALSARDVYNAVTERDWTGAGLAALGILPIIPSGLQKAKKVIKQIPTVNKNTQSLLDAKFSQLEKLDQAKSNYANEQYRIIERVMEDPSYTNRANEVRRKFGDDYSIPYADMFIAYNMDPSLLPNVQLMDDLTKAGTMGRTADGKFIYRRTPDNDYIPNTAEHELSHFTDLLKSGRTDAHAGNNMFYQMSKDLTKRVGDGRDNYFLLPTEQKAHMNQLREWMFKNGYINKRDQKITTEYMSKILKKLQNIEGTKGLRRAAQQFKSNRTFTKWFNSIPLIGVGAIGVNKYFADENKQKE